MSEKNAKQQRKIQQEQQPDPEWPNRVKQFEFELKLFCEKHKIQIVPRLASNPQALMAKIVYEDITEFLKNKPKNLTG